VRLAVACGVNDAVGCFRPASAHSVELLPDGERDHD
jgi:hypothetical protein